MLTVLDLGQRSVPGFPFAFKPCPAIPQGQSMDTSRIQRRNTVRIDMAFGGLLIKETALLGSGMPEGQIQVESRTCSMGEASSPPRNTQLSQVS